MLEVFKFCDYVIVPRIWLRCKFILDDGTRDVLNTPLSIRFEETV